MDIFFCVEDVDEVKAELEITGVECLKLKKAVRDRLKKVEKERQQDANDSLAMYHNSFILISSLIYKFQNQGLIYLSI